mmetsp:Transcript_40395/g.116085  ORF Transcript_40395/g.116085 Transcript_40395/m.116085 type:complete len:310 (+) Transcript_40395:1254-2183(+)
MADDRLEDMPDHAFEEIQDVILRDERHLAIDLRELWLAVSPKLLVAEALDDLEVPVHTGNHQQLLKGLRRLRQGVELSGVHPGGHDEVARPLGGRLDEDRGLHLDELPVTQEVPDQAGHSVPQEERLLDRVSADVEVSVPHAGVLLGIRLVLDLHWRRKARVQDLQGVGDNLDVPGRAVLVLVASLHDLAGHLDDELAAQLVGLLIPLQSSLVRTVLLEDDLRDAVAVPHIHEGEVVHVSGDLHPTRERHLLAYVRNAQIAACVAAVPGLQRRDRLLGVRGVEHGASELREAIALGRATEASRRPEPQT